MSVQVCVGDCIEEMRKLEPDSVDCVVTSSPYWGLRDYGVAGQLGLEWSLADHIAAMVAVFDEVRRVLKPEGTLWLNYGDCYAASVNGRSAADTKAAGNDDRAFRDKPFSTVQGSLKPKDLCMVPSRIAIALQDAGWWVRSEIIWAKPNPMPESVTDRPATSHEKIWLLTKSARYWYDADAVRVPRASQADYKTPDGCDTTTGEGGHGSIHKRGRDKGDANGFRGGSYVNGEPGPRTQKGNKQRGHGRRHDGFNARWDSMSKEEQQANGRNLRNYEPSPQLSLAPENDPADLKVWNMATQPFRGAHFATFPVALAERCIKAGCPPHGLVLDPFGGAGTTGLAADRLRRNALLIELNPEYAEIARQRVSAEMSLLDGVAWAPPEEHAA